MHLPLRVLRALVVIIGVLSITLVALALLRDPFPTRSAGVESMACVLAPAPMYA